MLFVVGDSSKREKGISLIQNRIVTREQRTCQDVLTPVEGYQNWLEEDLELLYGCSTIVYPNFQVLQKSPKESEQQPIGPTAQTYSSHPSHHDTTKEETQVLAKPGTKILPNHKWHEYQLTL